MTSRRTAVRLIAAGIGLLALGFVISLLTLLVFHRADREGTAFVASAPHSRTAHLERGDYIVYYTAFGRGTKYSADDLRAQVEVQVTGPDGRIGMAPRALSTSLGANLTVDAAQFAVRTTGEHRVVLAKAPGAPDFYSEVEVSFVPHRVQGAFFWIGMGLSGLPMLLGVVLLGIGRRLYGRSAARATGRGPG